MKTIGRTFSQELAAAGLLGLPFSWGADGLIEFDVSMTAAQRAAVLAVYEAHDAAAADRAAAWEAIKAERERRTAGGFKCGTYWFHSDAASKVQHLANKDTARDQIAAGGAMSDALLDPLTGDAIVWKTMSGEFVPLTCQMAFDIVTAAKAAELATFQAAQTHRTAMESSPDPAVYDFSSGWPPIYEDAVA